MKTSLMNRPAATEPENATDHRETDDNYGMIIERHGGFRVIICRCDHQWIFQQRRMRFKLGGTGWDHLAYVTSKTTLIRIAQQYSGHTWPKLDALPASFRKGGLL
jgi:hypothetical protein